jgi:hypothetical protein
MPTRVWRRHADDRRLGSLDARNPANDTEKTTKLTNRR